MSFQAVSIKTATVGNTALSISSTLFNFATSDLTGAQKAIIYPTSASLMIGYSTVTPTTAGSGIPVSSGTLYTVTGAANVANLKLIAQTTSASVTIQIEK